MVGVLNTYHRFPSTGNIYPNLVAIMFSAFGLLHWYAVRPIKRWSLSVIAWLVVFLLVLVQPFISSITYPDGMIFSLAILLFCIAFSLCLSNVELQQREKLYLILVGFLIVTATLTVVTQLLQYLKLDLPRSIIFPNFSQTRIGSNLGQPNQASFVLSLGVAGLLYLTSKTKRLAVSLLLIFPVAFLALGLGLTASRTGIILMIVALLGYLLLFHVPIRYKITVSTVALVLLVVGYLGGSQLLSSYNNMTMNSVERLSDGTINLRWYQLQQAAIIFNDNKLTGVGWGNLLGTSVHYAQELPWFAATAHTHFFASQIAVETGIIGLLTLCPFIYILLSNFSFRLSNYQAAVYTMLAIFVAYSCSEFPLWLPMYLVVFVMLLSLVNHRSHNLSKQLRVLGKSVWLVFSIMLVIGSIYYQVQYRSYSNIYYTLTESSLNQEEKIERLAIHSPVYGFEKFDDIFLFYLMSLDKVGLEHKRELADKVLSQSVSYPILTKTANIYLLAGQKEKALTLLKAACTFNRAKECPVLAQEMTQSASVGSNDLKWLNMQFQAWRQANPQKTGVTIKSNFKQ